MARRSSNCRLLSGLCSTLKTPGGDREMVEILAEQAVLAAVELALRLAPPTKTHILNVLHRLVDGKPIDPPAVKPPSALTLTAEPRAFRNSFPNGANRQTTGLNNFEKEKSVRLGACDRPFPLSNEIQRASIPTRLRYQIAASGRVGSGRAIAPNMDYRSNPSIGRYLMRRGAVNEIASRKCCPLMRTPTKERSNATRQRLERGTFRRPRVFDLRTERSPAIYRIMIADRRWTSAHAADAVSDLERAKGFEPSTPTLASVCPRISMGRGAFHSSPTTLDLAAKMDM